jgi:protease IV
MVHRRDIQLGCGLLAALAFVIVVSVILIAGLSDGGGYLDDECVGIVDIVGVIYSPDNAVEIIDGYAEDDAVRAVVIRLNTPGGGVSATQEIVTAIGRFRETGRPVVASMGTVAASGGYYVAAACDTIVATPGSVTGSIGVIAKYPEITGLLDKLGVGFNVVKSGKFKDTGSFSREMTDDERAYLEDVVLDIHDQFVEAVVEGRGLDEDYVREYADGRIFSGRQGHELGFVDELGDFRAALDIAGELSGLGVDPPVTRSEKTEFWGMLAESASLLASGFDSRSTPHISYLWSR